MKSYGTGVVTSEQSSKQSTGFISNYNECYSNAPTVENSQQPLQSNLDLDIKVSQNIFFQLRYIYVYYR